MESGELDILEKYLGVKSAGYLLNGKKRWAKEQLKIFIV